jgi:hypothetical protein
MQRSTMLLTSMRAGLPFLFACAFLLLVECVPLKAGEQSTETVQSSELWRAIIHVANKAQWRPGRRWMTITRVTEADHFYVPYDLSDAWRSLDKMLPHDYAVAAAHITSLDRCLNDTRDDIIVLHNGLIDFLAENWLENESSRYWIFFNQLEPSLRTTQDRLAARRLVAASTLCSYYNWQRTGSFPELQSVLKLLDSELKTLGSPQRTIH